MKKFDLSMTQVENISCWCDSGHFAKGNFKIDENDLPIRFFKIDSASVNGIYCEPCLVLANYIKNQQKKDNIK